VNPPESSVGSCSLGNLGSNSVVAFLIVSKLEEKRKEKRIN
jgi:hypothetical protein